MERSRLFLPHAGSLRWARFVPCQHVHAAGRNLVDGTAGKSTIEYAGRENSRFGLTSKSWTVLCHPDALSRRTSRDARGMTGADWALAPKNQSNDRKAASAAFISHAGRASANPRPQDDSVLPLLAD